MQAVIFLPPYNTPWNLKGENVHSVRKDDKSYDFLEHYIFTYLVFHIPKKKGHFTLLFGKAVKATYCLWVA